MDEVKKMYWRMGEVAKLVNRSHSLVRYWCHEFGIDPRRSHQKGGYRMFNEKELGQIFEINRLLKVELFTIAGAKKQMNIL